MNTTLVNFERTRRILLIQMLPHTLVGHPTAQMCLLIGRQDWADKIHFATLPTRAKRRMAVKPQVNPDPRLLSMDVIFTPLCSVARAFGLYRLADRIFRVGPHAVATELGACGYYYKPSTKEESAAKTAEAARKTAKENLERVGYRYALRRRKGTAYREPWVWISPAGRNPTLMERKWIELVGHELKSSLSTAEIELYDWEEGAGSYVYNSLNKC